MANVTTGKVISIDEGIVTVSGLSSVGAGELIRVKIGDNKYARALALNLEEDVVKGVMIDHLDEVMQGQSVESTGELPSIKVDDNVLGRVINVLGEVQDSSVEIQYGQDAKMMPMEKKAPGVIERKDVERPIETGILVIDALIPIGRGQRQLIIGDRQTGKTAIAVDAIINQKGKNCLCVYVAVGQKASNVANIVRKLKEKDAMDYTTVVVASANDPATQQYLAPYAGTAIAEYFAEKGQDVLVVIDDLTKHANAYRQMSLLLKRPSGREAYPGDVFYLHSRLLERALQYSDALGGGSITTLPIIETQANDLSAYIPTNVISITDGQIYLDQDLFNAGQKPALNVGLSVSRVGGAAQTKTMKSVAGKVKLDLAQFRELAVFAQLGSELDEATKAQLIRGEHITEAVKQAQYNPLPAPEQIVIMYSASQGFLDEMPLNEIGPWKKQIILTLKTKYPKVWERLNTGKEKVEGELADEINTIIKSYLD